jgi:hypothetical protein
MELIVAYLRLIPHLISTSHTHYERLSLTSENYTFTIESDIVFEVGLQLRLH